MHRTRAERDSFLVINGLRRLVRELRESARLAQGRAQITGAQLFVLRTLVADVASPEEGNEKFPQSIGEPLFELPLSGWYWQVTRLDTPKLL